MPWAGELALYDTIRRVVVVTIIMVSSLVASLVWRNSRQIPDERDREYWESRWPDLLAATTASDLSARCVALLDASKCAFNTRRYELAKRFADELVARPEECAGGGAVGDAVHDGNVVLGRLEIVAGNVEGAIEHLRLASSAPSSPTLSTFGPNMALARDLLLLGVYDPVLEYLERIRRIWDMHGDRIDDWSRQIRKGEVPRFGANLDY